MKLRPRMNTALSTDHSAAAVENKRIVCAHYSLVFDALKIPIIRGDIANSDPLPKCGNF
jgi:hypothetical protein